MTTATQPATPLGSSSPPVGENADGNPVLRYRAGVHPSAVNGHDEFLLDNGEIRPSWRLLAERVEAMGVSGLREGRELASRLLEDDGVTYHANRPEGLVEQPWELDPIPLLLDQVEWARLETALTQRAELLDRVLADLYGPRELIARHVLPPEVIYAHDGFLRACDGIRLPGPRQLFLAAADLARDDDGAWHVLGDRTQAPSGAGYAMENRRVVSRVLPSLYRSTGLQRLSPFFQAMRLGLQEIAPTAAAAPRVVLLNPGARSETAFDQAFLATLMGFPLVEGSDLTVEDGRVWLRALGRLEPVDVVLRRVDETWCDPVELRAGSRLGVPGLVEACRLGTVSVVNTLGSGVLENPGLLPYLPALCQALRDEPLLLPSVTTWWCGDPDSRRYVLEHLDQLVVRPLSHGQAHSQFGGALSRDAREGLARRIEAEPYSWVGQHAMALSTAPTVTPAGLEPRSTVLRTFAVAVGGSYRLMQGGLLRVAPEADQRAITNQGGALTKDVWVLTGGPAVTGRAAQEDAAVLPSTVPPMPPRVIEDLFWFARYAERAEDLVRLLRTIPDRAGDFLIGGDEEGVEALRALLRAVTHVTTTYPGFTAGEELFASPQAELYSLAAHETRPGTIAHAVAGMASCAHAIRDQLSSDTWLVLGRVERALSRLARTKSDNETALAVALAHVLEGLLAISGLAAENMVRDPGWRLMDAGRRIERALQLCSLLQATVTVRRQPGAEVLLLESVLVAAESIITYRRRHPDRPVLPAVLDLLVLDAGNPRSLSYQIERISEDLRAVPGSGGSSQPERLVERIAVRLRRVNTASLAIAGPGGNREALIETLAALHEALSELATSVANTHFKHPAALQPM